MSFTNVFGGTSIQASPTSYSALALTANVTLIWPLEAASSTSTANMLIDVTPSAGSYAITLPDATKASPGSSIIFNNKSGAYTFLIKDSGGNTLGTAAVSAAYLVYITTNATSAGTWDVLLLAGSTVPVNAAALTGYGTTVAPAGKIGTATPVTTKTVNWSMAVADRAGLFVWTGGAGTWTLLDPAVAGANMWAAVNNQGTGQLTLSPAAGLIKAAASLVLAAGEGAVIATDGANWWTQSYSRVLTNTGISLLALATTGGTTTLTVVQSGYGIIAVSGALISNATIVFPAAVGRWWMSNQTTGNFTVTCAVAGGDPGVTIPQLAQQPILSDSATMRYGVTITSVITSWTTVTADPNPAATGIGYLCNTTGAAFNLTLPASPSVGTVIGVCDAAGTFQTNALTVVRNGNNIMGLAANLTVNMQYANFLLVYQGATYGWRLLGTT